MTVNDEKFEDNEVYQLYNNRRNEQVEEYTMESVEEINVRNISIDATEFRYRKIGFQAYITDLYLSFLRLGMSSLHWQG